MKLLTAIKCYFGGAWSWAGYFGDRPADKETSWSDNWGWTSAGMDEHWASYKADPSYHQLKNLGAEWARLAPQRAYKALAFVGCFSAICAFVTGLGLGILL